MNLNVGHAFQPAGLPDFPVDPRRATRHGLDSPTRFNNLLSQVMKSEFEPRKLKELADAYPSQELRVNREHRRGSKWR